MYIFCFCGGVGCGGSDSGGAGCSDGGGGVFGGVLEACCCFAWSLVIQCVWLSFWVI